jgi:hypothetical protein
VRQARGRSQWAPLRRAADGAPHEEGGLLRAEVAALPPRPGRTPSPPRHDQYEVLRAPALPDVHQAGGRDAFRHLPPPLRDQHVRPAPTLRRLWLQRLDVGGSCRCASPQAQLNSKYAGSLCKAGAVRYERKADDGARTRDPWLGKPVRPRPMSATLAASPYFRRHFPRRGQSLGEKLCSRRERVDPGNTR